MKPTYFLSLIVISLFLASCQKYLDAKPDKKMVVPTTLEEVQGILDYFPFMNTQCSQASEIAADNYYLTDNEYEALSDVDKLAYTWAQGMFQGMNDWQFEYTVVYNANVVLENLPKIQRNSSNEIAWDYCKGSAFFFRGKSFYEIAQIWTKAYDSSTAQTDLGIPLRLTSDFNVPSKRSNLAETYQQIISDLQNAINLIPKGIQVTPYRPSKAAAYGLLARTYLAMRDYKNAALYADSCLQLRNGLLDFNTVTPGPVYTFSAYQFTNPEDIFHSNTALTNFTLFRGTIDTVLYNSYDSNDLRKTFYFGNRRDGTRYFKGSYDPGTYYNGITTDEMYLIKAECLAREGEFSQSMQDLNTLLVTKWKTGTFVPYTAGDKDEALAIILTERRKELLYRMLRFTDIKRLNKEGANITIRRIIDGKTYNLPPNDPQYALPIPQNVVRLSGIQQN
jgi:hypothetical protein